jgi:hypothetical protein
MGTEKNPGTRASGCSPTHENLRPGGRRQSAAQHVEAEVGADPVDHRLGIARGQHDAADARRPEAGEGRWRFLPHGIGQQQVARQPAGDGNGGQ